LLATGGTMAATLRLIEQLGGHIVGVAFLIELAFLHGRESSRASRSIPSSSTTEEASQVGISTRIALVRGGATLLAGTLLTLGAWAPGASAEEAKTPVSASMILSIFAQPIEPRVSAFDQALREDGPPPRAAACTPQADGSVRCGTGAGSVAVTVRNPCPPGT